MNKSDMTLERMKEILAAYGADPALWPADERPMAEAFIAASTKARELADCARALDLQLAAAPTPSPASAAFMDRLASMEVPKHAVPKPAAGTRASLAQLFGFNSFLPRAVGLASICALGIVVGASGIGRTTPHTQVIDASAYLITNPALMTEIKEID